MRQLSWYRTSHSAIAFQIQYLQRIGKIPELGWYRPRQSVLNEVHLLQDRQRPKLGRDAPLYVIGRQEESLQTSPQSNLGRNASR
mmetsp:Transcript_88910/g.133303  ORF Transcript_88910/g.133303 Transcript_88910/m.133303 type:complete len:85 (-) Transcript_88910:681-935(-)